MLKYALLGFLNYQPMTGYELKQFMDGSTAFFWHAELSQIYTTLKKLEQEGSVSSYLEARPDRPDRRVYSILPAGQSDLLSWLETPLLEIEQRKETLLLRIFFSAKLDRQKLLAQMHWLRELHVKQLAIFQGPTVDLIQQVVDQLPALGEDAPFWDATRRFGVMYEEIYLRWLDEMISLLEGKEP